MIKVKSQVYDVAFKKIAVELSRLKGLVNEAVEELGIDPGRISNRKTSIKVAARVPHQPVIRARNRKGSGGYKKN